MPTRETAQSQASTPGPPRLMPRAVPVRLPTPTVLPRVTMKAVQLFSSPSSGAAGGPGWRRLPQSWPSPKPISRQGAKLSPRVRNTATKHTQSTSSPQLNR